ncbi:MAG: VanZ family protein [Gammaproteobacteria bacterium]
MEQPLSPQIKTPPPAALWALGALLALAVALMLIADQNGADIQDLSLTWPGSDKAAHFLTHLGLTGLIQLILSRFWTSLSRQRTLALAVLGSLSLGLIDETQQFFVGGRDFDLFDVAANVCGTASAALLIAGFSLGPRRFALLAVLPVSVFATVYAHSYTQTRLFNAGILQIRAGELAAARASFREAIARGQGHAALYNELAWLELEFLDVDPADALRYTTLAVAAEPDDPGIIDTHGWALHRNGRHREALAFLQQALAGDPGIYNIHYHLGAVYHALGDEPRAAEHLRRQISSSGTGTYAERSRELLARLDGHPD